MFGSLPKPFVSLASLEADRNPERGVVAVTQGLPDLLEQEEAEGVIAHEIAHVIHRDTLTMTVGASPVGAALMLVTLAQWAAISTPSSDRVAALRALLPQPHSLSTATGSPFHSPVALAGSGQGPKPVFSSSRYVFASTLAVRADGRKLAPGFLDSPRPPQLLTQELRRIRVGL